MRAATPPIGPRIGAHTCAQTGLRLAPSHGQAVYRVAKPSYGPLNPQQRRADSDECMDWGRFDVPGHRTIYASTVAEAAYAECTASLRPNLELLRTPLSTYFDDLGPADHASTVGDLVQQEWDERHMVRVGNVACIWRTERRLYRITLPPTGWFVQVEHADSLAAIADAIGPRLLTLTDRHHRPSWQLTIADLRAELAADHRRPTW